MQEKIYDEYVAEFVKEVKSWKIGSPTEEKIYIGPLSRKEQILFLGQQVKDALQKGASLETGGKPLTRKGYFLNRLL